MLTPANLFRFIFLIVVLFQFGQAQATYRKTTITYSGKIAPGTGGATFSSVIPPSAIGMSESGVVLFSAWLEGSGVSFENDEGIWVFESDTLRLLARKGGAVPGMPGVSIGTDSIMLKLGATVFFQTTPTVERFVEGLITDSLSFDSSSSGYTVSLPYDSLSLNGSYLVSTVDSSGQPFRFSLDYAVAVPDSGRRDVLFSAGGGTEATIDNIDGSVRGVMFLTSEYPLPRTGLSEINRQISSSLTLDVLPNMLSGAENSITIRYTEEVFSADPNPSAGEESLQLYHWNVQSGMWEPLVSTVNTARNTVTAAITETGLFAVFTTNVIPPSCCMASTGNIDCDPNDVADIADLTRLIDHLFISLAPLCCRAEGNVDGDPNGEVVLADLTRFIDHLFISLQPTSPCR